MSNLTKVSIVIPFYNEEEGIPFLKERLDKEIKVLSLSYKIELILIDDGSSDATYDLLKQYFPAAVLIRHDNNKGIGSAVRSSIKAASGEFICFLDSDCTYPPEELDPMLKTMQKSNQIDILSASQYHPKGRVLNVPYWRLFFSWGASFLYRLVLPRKLYTYTSFFRVFKKDVLAKIKFENDGFIAVTEIIVRAIYMGFKIEEYPTTLSTRLHGVSKMKTLQVIINHLQFMFNLSRLKRKLKSCEQTS